MTDKWIISDTHFGHANIIKFQKPDGSPIRPGYTKRPTRAFTSFRDIQHHDEALIENWNSVVKPGDKVYHLGDFGRVENAKRLNGKIRLILGNHDDRIEKEDLVSHFDKILVSKVFKNDFGHSVIFSHFPLHRDERAPAPRHINIHGHIHEKRIMNNQTKQPDPWYVNVCVEHTNCYPVHWDEMAHIVKKSASILEDW